MRRGGKRAAGGVKGLPPGARTEGRERVDRSGRMLPPQGILYTRRVKVKKIDGRKGTWFWRRF